VEILKSVNAKQEPPPLAQPFSTSHENKSEEPKIRASILEFKEVNKIYIYTRVQPILPELILYSWDKKEYKYKIVELLTPPDKINKLDYYIFVIRTRIGEYPSFDPNLRS
jgi:hypothetical protein